MSLIKESWKSRLGSLVLGVLSVTLAVGWWLDRQSQTARGETTAAVGQRAPASSEPIAEPNDAQAEPKRFVLQRAAETLSYSALRDQNEDLTLFIDEAYQLLFQHGIHVQLDIEETPDGRLRLKADTLKLLNQLEAKLNTVDPQPMQAEEPAK